MEHGNTVWIFLNFIKRTLSLVTIKECVNKMKRLQLVLMVNGEPTIDYDLPDSILESLEGGNKIKPVYHGWCPRWGVLSFSDKGGAVMTGRTNDDLAGFVSISLEKKVDDKTNKGFLHYMTWGERREKGFI